MLYTMARNWWAFVLRGSMAVAFGISALAWPALTLTVLVTLFGAYAILDGLLSIGAALRSGDEVQWSLLIWGALGAVAGVSAIAWPGISALLLVFLIATWAMLTGVAQIAAAIAWRKQIKGEWMLALAGLLSIVVGTMLGLRPGAGALSLTWLIGAYAIVFGVVLAIAGFRLRGWRRSIDAAVRAGA